MTTIKKTIILISIILFCFLLTAAPVSAATQAGAKGTQKYGIEVSLDLADYDSIWLSGYRKNAFLIQDEATKCYAVADRDAAHGCYYITGWAYKQENATCFTSGLGSADPRLLAIYGFNTGTYIMHHVKTTKGYDIWTKDIAFTLADNHAQLLGLESRYERGTRDHEYTAFPFSIKIDKSSEHPNGYPYNDPVVLVLIILVGVETITICIGTIKYLRYRKKRAHHSKVRVEKRLHRPKQPDNRENCIPGIEEPKG